MTVSVVIPTYNRPDDLDRCLASLARQTQPPAEVIVVDDGHLPALPHAGELTARGCRCRLERKAEKGLTRSRNLGLDLAVGEIVAFFDDDVELAPDYLELLVAAYEALPDIEVGGIGGSDLNLRPATPFTWLEYAYDRLFLISPRRPGLITASGFSEQMIVSRVRPGRELYRADLLSGAMMSFHRRAFSRFRFDESYSHGYCQGEDKEYSARVGAVYPLYVAPAAKLRHFVSPVERVDKYRRGRDYILSMYMVFVRYRRRQRWHSLLFLYSLVGYAAKKTVAAALKCRRDELDRLRGIAAAFWRIVTGRAG